MRCMAYNLPTQPEGSMVSVLAIHTVNDGVLGVIAPIGLAASMGTCLVVDLVIGRQARGVSLAKMVQDGPTSAQLRPEARGISFLRNGGVESGEAAEVVEALATGWPNVVLRVRTPEQTPDGVRAVQVEAVLRGPFVAPVGNQSVLQPVGLGGIPRGHNGPVLAKLRARTARSILTGHLNPRWKWIQSWSQVWEAS